MECYTFKTGLTLEDTLKKLNFNKILKNLKSDP